MGCLRDKHESGVDLCSGSSACSMSVRGHRGIFRPPLFGLALGNPVVSTARIDDVFHRLLVCIAIPHLFFPVAWRTLLAILDVAANVHRRWRCLHLHCTGTSVVLSNSVGRTFRHKLVVKPFAGLRLLQSAVRRSAAVHHNPYRALK